MILVTSQIALLLFAIILPLSTRKNKLISTKENKIKIQFKIDTDTSNALYAINENGALENFNRIIYPGQDSQIEVDKDSAPLE